MSLVKKIRKVAMYMLLFFLLLLVAVFAFVNTPRIQTLLAIKVASYLSKELKTEVIIESVEIEFLKTAVLHGLQINDLHHDTLIYAKEAKLNYTGFFKKENRIQFSILEVSNARLKLKQYKNEKDLNIDFFVDFIDPPSTVKRPKGYIYQTIASKNLRLNNIFFSYRFEADTSITDIFNSSDIQFKNINADVSDFKVLRDTVSFYCNNLEAKERCGLKINKLNSSIKISPAFVQFNNFKLETANSKLAGTFHLNTNSYRDYNNFEELVFMNGNFAPSTFELADAAYFNDVVKGLKMRINIKGEIKGTEASIKGKNLDIKFGKNSSFKGNVSMKGLPNWEETFTHLEVKELITNKADLEQIQSYPFTTGERISLPKEIEKLGKISVTGTFTGFESDFVSTAIINTKIGLIETDIEMKTNDTNSLAYYIGKLKTENFNLGKYYELEDYVGNITLDVEIDGKGLKKNNVNANINGLVSVFNFNSYDYKNIELNGVFSKDIFSGIFNLNDENAILDFDGKIDLSQKLPSYNFISNVKYLDLQKTKLATINNTAIFSTKLKVDIEGDNIDNLLGTINATNTIYQEQYKAYKINDILLDSRLSSSGKKLILKSDIVNGSIEGKYTFMKIGKTFKQMVINYIPSLENNKKVIESMKDKAYVEHFNFDFVFMNSQPLSKSILKKIEIMPGTTMNGHFYADEDDFTFNCKAREMKLLNYAFKNVEITAAPNIDNNEAAYSLKMNANKIMFSDSSFIEAFSLTNYLKNDTLKSKLDWANNSKIKNYGNIELLSNFKFNSTKVRILPSQLYIQDSLISINPENYMNIDSLGLTFNKMEFSHNLQSISFNSQNNDNGNEIAFIFKNFNMNWLNSVYKKNGINLSGTLDGQGTLGFSNNNFIFTASISLADFKINNELLGNGSLICVYNDAKESIAINGKFLKGDYTVLSTRGYYYPYKEDSNLDLEVSLDKFSLKYAEIYTKDIFSNINGFVSGDLILKGTAEEPILEGSLELQKSSFKIDYLNTNYSFNGFVKFEENKISFKDILFNDVKGNKGIASGTFLHDFFKDLKYKINIKATKLMCLNTTASQNETFYGKAFASGNIKVAGDLNNVSFNIAAVSEKGTFFVIPLYGAEEISSNNFIEFLNNDSIKKNIEKKLDLSGIEMAFELELTPDAEIQMMFDPKVGDAITGSGNGIIKMNIDTKGDFTMFGNYIVEKGNYLFTLQNVINRNFKIERGGSIQWTGDPFNADININAIYNLKTPLKSVYPADESNRRVPVECKLMMTDKLMKPTIKFDINLPNADQTTRDAVRSTINADNEAELNKQVFSLLVLGTFFPSQESGVLGTSAAKNNGSELLSNQMSNWLGQTFKNLDLNLKYNSSSGSSQDATNRQIAIAASKQLFNSKLTIDGTFGVGENGTNNNSQNPTNIIGDVNIDYKVTNNGKVHVKAFNRSNDYSTLLNSSPYIQGIGLIYREDFETIYELRKRFKERQRLKNSN